MGRPPGWTAASIGRCNAVTGTTPGTQAPQTGILDADRRGTHQRGRRDCMRRVGTYRIAVVPPHWRQTTYQVDPGIGKTSRSPSARTSRCCEHRRSVCVKSRAGPDATGRKRRDRRWVTAWSPEQISNRLCIDFPDNPSMCISHEAIYQTLYIEGRGGLERKW